MSDERNTARCPACATVFRVTVAQLAARKGQVRCGRCHTVFDATKSIVVAPSVAPAASPSPTLSSYRRISQKHARWSGEPQVTTDEQPANRPAEARDSSVVDEPDEAQAVLPSEAAPRPRRRVGGVALALALPILLALLIAQTAFYFRDAIASHWPAAGPTLHAFCAVAGCALRPLHEDNRAFHRGVGPAGRSLAQRSADPDRDAAKPRRFPVGYPYFELTLTDAQDQAVVRRALAPKGIRRGNARTSRAAFPRAPKSALKLFIDASTTYAGRIPGVSVLPLRPRWVAPDVRPVGLFSRSLAVRATKRCNTGQ